MRGARTEGAGRGRAGREGGLAGVSALHVRPGCWAWLVRVVVLQQLQTLLCMQWEQAVCCNKADSATAARDCTGLANTTAAAAAAA